MKSIVWIASWPRSGNTLMRIILNTRYGIKSRSLHNDTGLGKSKELLELVGHHGQGQFYLGGKGTFFIKTHELHREHNAIYIVRDGRDAVVSYAKHLENFSGETFNKELLRRCILGTAGMWASWGQHIDFWLHRRAAGTNTIVFRFEDLTNRGFSFIDMDIALKSLGVSTIPPRLSCVDFQHLHSMNSKFFRSGKTGQWQEHFDKELHELFWSQHGDQMDRLGYVK